MRVFRSWRSGRVCLRDLEMLRGWRLHNRDWGWADSKERGQTGGCARCGHGLTDGKQGDAVGLRTRVCAETASTRRRETTVSMRGFASRCGWNFLLIFRNHRMCGKTRSGRTRCTRRGEQSVRAMQCERSRRTSTDMSGRGDVRSKLIFVFLSFQLS